MIPQDELDDFRDALTKYGYSPDDFELTEQSDEPTTSDVEPQTGTVQVVHKGTGKWRHYESGHSTSWVSVFEEDLERGFFRG